MKRMSKIMLSTSFQTVLMVCFLSVFSLGALWAGKKTNPSKEEGAKKYRVTEATAQPKQASVKPNNIPEKSAQTPSQEASKAKQTVVVGAQKTTQEITNKTGIPSIPNLPPIVHQVALKKMTPMSVPKVVQPVTASDQKILPKVVTPQKVMPPVDIIRVQNELKNIIERTKVLQEQVQNDRAKVKDVLDRAQIHHKILGDLSKEPLIPSGEKIEDAGIDRALKEEKLKIFSAQVEESENELRNIESTNSAVLNASSKKSKKPE